MKQVYKSTLLICIAVIIICFIMRLFGYSGFYIPIIESSLNNNLTIILICYGMLYILNSILIIILIVKRKLNIRAYIIISIIFLLYYIVGLFIEFGYFKMLIEVILIAAISIIYTKNPKSSIESLLMYGLMLLYQYITMKTKGLVIAIAEETFTTSLIFQIDFYMLIILALLYFTKKGEHLYELVYKLICEIKWRSLAFFRIPSKRNSKEKCLQQNEKNFQEVDIEIGYVIFNLVLFIFQMLLVLSICYFIKHTVLNVILIYLSFIILRKLFGASYHADTILKCTTLSVLLFILATSLSLDINISLLSCIFIGLALAYGMHVYYYYDNYIKQSNDITKLSLEELKIKLYYLTEVEVNLVYDYWHKDKHIPADDIADKYGYNKMKIYRTIKKIKDNNL